MPAPIGFLRRLGHDVVPAAQLGLSQAEDAEMLRVAQEQELQSSFVVIEPGRHRMRKFGSSPGP